ncbi:SAM-dependent methyltransferase [Schleiferilactobacillus perolens DSM 12744]|uniref:SAM-dependent methyltransferase n=2 Tax=Schleiferilactobacillus perolens TaxID=100468 RepID=A0A0R1MVY9_9LACO|nr:SAM-dependent methyltransferase [Schleiferilactobacillus perolens DSM 12744]
MTMTNTIYDDPSFFDAYSHMARSEGGLPAAGEWQTLKSVLPDFTGKTVLDLGCGYGWHCRYAVEHGAKYVLGIDSSAKMIEQAQSMTHSSIIDYRVMDMTAIDELKVHFDVILSSLAIHYIQDYKGLVAKIYARLNTPGTFIMSVEHPIFTAQGSEEWIKDQNGNTLYWPVDRYFDESSRETDFLDHKIKKYHRTMTTYLETLIKQGFRLTNVIEPQPPVEMQKESAEMRDELRRPMMLIVTATKG